MRRWLWMCLVIGCCGISVAEKGIPVNFKAAYVELDALEKKLAENGLNVIGKHAVAGNTNYTSIVYTSTELKKLSQAKDRGFVSVLRILHNADTRELVASNPEYYIRAFYQKDYKGGSEAPVVKALKSALGTLTPVDQSLSAKKLAKYHFMMGMPYYDDFVRVAKGSTQDLLGKLKANAGDRVIFELDLKGDGSSILCGVALPVHIEKFNEKLGTMDQSHLLPYTVLIENGKANILHAKFYLALAFPDLTMGEFMKIRAVPGNIAKAFKADFK